MGIVDVVLPTTCAGCRRRGPSPCAACVSAMEPGGWVSAGPVPVVAAVRYSGVARELVLDLKYRRRRSAVGWMADAVVAAVGWAGVRPDVVTWVPASRPGRRQRGFDQGQLLAHAVGERLGRRSVAVLDRAGTGRQVGLDRAGRATTAAAIVAVARAARVVDGREVLVIDDVVTTGASIATAETVLRGAGARLVVGAAFAHKA